VSQSPTDRNAHAEDIRITFLKEVGRFVTEYNIEASIANGVDPMTGEIGRDLDFYVPDGLAANRLIRHSLSAYQTAGFPWSTAMSPKWGPRSIGFTTDLYSELHVLPNVRVGSLVVTDAFRLSATPGPYGLPVDPSIILSKLIVKKSRSVRQQRPLWEPLYPEYLRQNLDAIKQNTKPDRTAFRAFCDVFLKEDSPDVISARKRLFRDTIVEAWKVDCLGSTQASFDFGRKRIDKISGKASLYLTLVSNHDEAFVRQWLYNTVGHTLLGFHVKTRPWSLRQQIPYWGRQQLLVHLASSSEIVDQGADSVVHLDDASLEQGIGSPAQAEIFDALVRVNHKWNARYHG